MGRFRPTCWREICHRIIKRQSVDLKRAFLTKAQRTPKTRHGAEAKRLGLARWITPREIEIGEMSDEQEHLARLRLYRLAPPRSWISLAAKHHIPRRQGRDGAIRIVVVVSEAVAERLS